MIEPITDCALCGKALQSCGECRAAQGDRLFDAMVCAGSLAGMAFMAAMAVLAFVLVGGLL